MVIIASRTIKFQARKMGIKFERMPGNFIELILVSTFWYDICL